MSNARKGRGAVSSVDGRYAKTRVFLDEAAAFERDQEHPDTVLRAMGAKQIISKNTSPDVPFNRSINPYQGCEHGCVYCYARPSHSYMDLSPGLDFETQIFYKPNAARLLIEEWQKPGYTVEPITLGANTDPYQPAERKTRVTRELLELFDKHQHPYSIITKGSLILRDLDILERSARNGLVSVAISVPTLSRELKRIMEPRVSAPETRLKIIRTLRDAGVPVSVLVAPVIPMINDNEIESIIAAVAENGAKSAAYVFLRLPHEVKTIFKDWLAVHFPDRAEHVMSLVRQASGGRDYDNRFGHRQRGRGAYADLLSKRFSIACRQHGLVDREYVGPLNTTRFRAPGARQLGLAF